MTNISHLLSHLDECRFRSLECGLANAEAALLQAVQAIAFAELNDRTSQQQRDNLQLELSRMVTSIARLNHEIGCFKASPEESRILLSLETFTV